MALEGSFVYVSAAGHEFVLSLSLQKGARHWTKPVFLWKAQAKNLALSGQFTPNSLNKNSLNYERNNSESSAKKRKTEPKHSVQFSQTSRDDREIFQGPFCLQVAR